MLSYLYLICQEQFRAPACPAEHSFFDPGRTSIFDVFLIGTVWLSYNSLWCLLKRLLQLKQLKTTLLRYVISLRGKLLFSNQISRISTCSFAHVLCFVRNLAQTATFTSSLFVELQYSPKVLGHFALFVFCT